MTQRERVERPREKRNVVVHSKFHLAAAEPVVRYEPVYVVECRRIREESHVIFFYPAHQRQHLLVYLSESVEFLFSGKLLSAEDVFSGHHYRFAADHFMVVRQSLEKHSQHPRLSGFICVFRFSVAVPVS